MHTRRDPYYIVALIQTQTHIHTRMRARSFVTLCIHVHNREAEKEEDRLASVYYIVNKRGERKKKLMTR